MIPDLNRRWTLAEATALLWAHRISLRPRADGYHLVDVRRGTTQKEQLTDDLTEALVLGCAMAELAPGLLLKPVRRRRPPPTRRARIKRHNKARLRRPLRHLRPKPK